jgi:hypothetical protein
MNPHISGPVDSDLPLTAVAVARTGPSAATMGND